MNDLAALLATTYIARRDVKAKQASNGDYMPVQHCTECGRGFCNHESPKVRDKWTMTDIADHLAKKSTYGHYMLNEDDQCKLFAFDIDLEKDGFYPYPYEANADGSIDGTLYRDVVQFHPREDWLNRAHPARGWLKLQLKTVAHVIARQIRSELDIPVACAYTGAKGLHVYGLTGLMSAKDVRDGAQIVIESLTETSLGALSPTRGSNFYKFDNQDPETGHPNIQIELFPKQSSLEKKDLGNLMRLPLGTNLKNPRDPTFFVDMTTALTEITPLDPVVALTEASIAPWRHASE